MSTENKVVTLKQPIEELSVQIEGFLKHDGKGNFTQDSLGAAWAGTMPEGLTVEGIERGDKHRANFTAAARTAVGRAAHKIAEKDTSIERFGAEFQLGKFSDLEIIIDRSAVVPDRRRNPETNAPEIVGEKTVYGRSTVKLSVKGGEASKGDLKAAGEVVTGLFTSSFGGGK